ncbi:DAZ interacting zinc finger protein 1 [Lasioglossum baleicum]|uniref:DAZ interacting zinc finger protein 1 n=1 Tax=Lasioglossum baleicum TaxID=434251 RepID=UPI003FCDF539
MAFSFRVGTKWCHDFPKLARESGFYFNMHKSRIRVDWNRISNIDIDRIIRDRDFYVIDDNINSVIDYSLESEYDIKILDSSFVKLFRLAQLAVEYLLYCKEYLDHSVVILKDELKSKIEENVKLKKEIETLEEVVKHLKEKAKDRSKLIETKIGDSSGEIFKCPHCSKTFISSMFLSGHILRRHAYMSDLCMTSSPVHDHYRSETEKLHNEIKNLKERLNETEKVIRNESEKGPEKKRVRDSDQRLSESEVENIKHDNKPEENQGYKEYQEEIRSLKTMLFDEIHSLRQKEKILSEKTSETSVHTLMNQQEKEFQKLRNQLFERLTPDIENVQAKLQTQENFWKSKIEQLENQHHNDVERLTMELKQTQRAAENMRTEYESKVNDLERQTANQSNILSEQSKRIHSLSNELSISQLNEKNRYCEKLSGGHDQPTIPNQFKISVKEPERRNFKKNDYVDAKTEQIIVEDFDDTSSPQLQKKVFPVKPQNKFTKTVHTVQSGNKDVPYEDKASIKQKGKDIVKHKKLDDKKIVEKDLKGSTTSDGSESEDSESEKRTINEVKHTNREENDHFIIKSELNESTPKKLEDMFDRSIYNRFLSSTKNSIHSETSKKDVSSEMDSESVTSESSSRSISKSITVVNNNSPVNNRRSTPPTHSKAKKTTQHNVSRKRLRENLLDAFEQKLKDIGIDPEWQGIPKATFKQKMDILKHHQKISMKKIPKYHEMKSKIIQKVRKEISKDRKGAEHSKHSKTEISDNFERNAKSTPIKTFRDRKNSGTSVSILQAPDRKLYSSPESDDSIRNENENELLSVRPAKISSYKNMESLVEVSSLTKLADNTPQPQDSLSKMKSLFESVHHQTRDSKTMLDVRPIRNEDIDNSNMQLESQNISISPKHNKSVLKSANGSSNSLIKKKVNFDLEDEVDSESSFHYDDKKDQSHEKSWDILSAFDEQKHLPEKEGFKNTSNIVLKTSQSDKIAEISRKLEEKLSMVRQKPVGSVETIFSSKYIQDKQSPNINTPKMSSTNISSLLESSLKGSTLNSKLNNSVPRPAPRNSKDKTAEALYMESVSEISDLDAEINDILKLE